MSSPPSTQDASRPPSNVQGALAAETRRERLKRWVASSPRLHAAIIGALALALVVLGVAHLIVVKRVRDAAIDERAAVLQSATQTMAAQTSSLLRLSALPLGWAIRSALLKDDFAAADAYLQRVAQEKHVTGAALVTVDGKVRLAGSRKLEGRPATDVFPGVPLNESAPVVISSEHELRAVIPIMEIDRRLGTFIFSYTAPTVEVAETASGQR